jgi:hypothetical protein
MNVDSCTEIILAVCSVFTYTYLIYFVIEIIDIVYGMIFLKEDINCRIHLLNPVSLFMPKTIGRKIATYFISYSIIFIGIFSIFFIQ